jgi:hypothetical protein
MHHQPCWEHLVSENLTWENDFLLFLVRNILYLKTHDSFVLNLQIYYFLQLFLP